ncbi:hypothetical protein HS961_06005 [Comamonas piscis]|uniref:Uncharacterized protein n=1 Tax=Comamonas piscis TaxID=1562974 RepID=A0A7G5EEJ8_9BURK|nr:hypothetical protein [Comamonas piscis]QMV72423.1 hypothetical protein HS961_06005 [Comamonas piscis]WSO35190.1 hypothetical protein VUJ63_06030 [Comamonas piscis]
MQNPKILGRMEEEDDDDVDERASTTLFTEKSASYEAGAIGKVTVAVFKSNDMEDRGGLVLRITLENQASSFVPHSKNLENGIELHMAGDAEAASLVRALKEALASI